jgi:ankyrin repeat protein
MSMLLKAGANPDMQLKLFPPYRSLRDDRGADGMLTVGTTPLVRAAKAVDVPAIKLLLAAGANVELPTVNGVTPLLAAAGVGSGGLDTRGRYRSEPQAAEAVKLLLAAGADVRARDKSGNTALHAAASAGWNSVVSMLAAGNADLFARDGRGRTAVELTKGEAGGGGRSAGIQAQPETEALLRKLMAAAQPAPAKQ